MADTSAQAMKDDDRILKDIIATESLENEEALLENAPVVDMSLLSAIHPKKSLLLSILKALFLFLALASVSSFIFFTLQMTGALSLVGNRFQIQTMIKNITETNARIVALQIEFDYNRHLQTKGFLDEFSYDGDSYLQNYETSISATASQTEKDQALVNLAALKEKLKTSFIQAREKYVVGPLPVLVSVPGSTDAASNDAIFRQALISNLTEKANKLKDSDDPQTKREYKNLINTIKLVGNAELNALMVSTDFDSLTSDQLYMLVKKVNLIIVNDMSVIEKIKEMRIKWSDIMNEIETRTIAVDNHYKENFYDLWGGIRYTSYDFDSDSRNISIIGDLKRFDTINFTMIANLIDELNKSGLFGGAEMKTFSKSGSLDEGYVSSIKLTVKLKDANLLKNAEDITK